MSATEWEAGTGDMSTDFFNTDYRLQSAGVGTLWLTISVTPLILWAILNPGYTCNYWNSICQRSLSSGTRHAWNVMRYGTGLNFGIMTAFWLLAYIRKENRIF